MPRVRFAAEMPRATREDAIRVAIIRDGKIFFGDQSIESNRLAEKIRRAWGTGAERRVYLRVDAQSRYSSVKEVLDAVRAAGVQDVSFRVEQKKPFGL